MFIMWYSHKNLLSHSNGILFITIGSRGEGKTYDFKKYCINKFLNKEEEFVYIRRYKTELETIGKFFDDIIENEEFPDLELTVKNSKNFSKFMVNGINCGYAIPLSTANVLKSTSFAKVTTIVFDEFIIDDFGIYHYLRNEVNQFLETLNTIARLRKFRCIMLSNAMSISNPYFDYFHINPANLEGIKTYNNGTIVVEKTHNHEYQEKAMQCALGRLIKGTAYEKYAIQNNWLNDNPEFIQQRPPQSKLMLNLKIDKSVFGVWFDDQSYYISTKTDPNFKITLALTNNDHDSKTLYIHQSSVYLQNLKMAYQLGNLFFDDQSIKNKLIKFLK